jgi:uncharacterized protein
MKRHLIQLTAGIFFAVTVVSVAGAQSPFSIKQSPFSVNLTPALDNVAHETRQRDAGAVAQLLAGGGDPNQADNGRSALAIATIDDNRQIAAMLVKAGARLNDQDDEGATPLHHAVELNHVDMVRLLLDNGAAVDPQNREGLTPLMLAASHGDLTVVELLLAKGANPAKTDFTGHDALGWAGDQPRIVQLLQRGEAKH